ncbi:protein DETOXIFICATION 44, chloroplastic isoform X2 [Impatiens glandulifera]|uniref:protein DETOXIFICATION 44, chloroplastic isoform X2 n=1 Tax=Impatiens glandulifera TaxID=253017 RepID=UPI001FB131AA|nr:protein DETOXIFICATION 44, chloroplastic isoform X2 [Impatiens glandulifera]
MATSLVYNSPLYSLNHRHRGFCCIHSPPSKHQPPFKNLNYSDRLRRVLKSSSYKNPTRQQEASSDEETKTKVSDDRLEIPAPTPPTSNQPFSFKYLRRLFRETIRIDELGLDILSIALPAALALAADPITSLVDSAFVGHLGSVELASVGVSISVFNLVSKLFNVPLLNITTSFVAEEQAMASVMNNDSSQTGQDENQNKRILPSVSVSLALAAFIGIVEAIALSLGSSFLMDTMGIAVDSPMRIPAEHFLTLRALGAPPVVIALAAQGTFRGFKDTKTPLYAVGAGNLLNAMLDAILIFRFGFGVGGAAIATVISEYLIAFILLWKLNDEVELISPKIDGRKMVQYLQSGGLLIGRSLAVLTTLTLSTSVAAREGPIPMAGHQICSQVWLGVSLITDALALAGQALLASNYSQASYSQARQVIYKVIQIGLFTGVSLSIILFLGFGALSSLFTDDSNVITIALSGTLFVAGSQPINAIAFVIDGLYYGVSDFEYAAYSMVVIGIISSLFLILVAPAYGLVGVWMGLFLFMTLRVLAGIWRLSSKDGPWKLVWSDMEKSVR